ncbi:MAG: ActS/PrrB/RegB family redox-sensitive histidine kinase [Hyphomicrobium sp.]|jgi:two-component system sensor histidine kinase RegB
MTSSLLVSRFRQRFEPKVNYGAESRLRLQTIVRLRWLGVIGQIFAVCFVYFGLGFDLPIGAALICIAISAWVNVYLAIRHPARHRLSVNIATALLAYDVLQLASLLYLTGGVANPFTMLLVAPVTVSAATLPLGHTIALGVLALAASSFIALYHMPLPWHPVSSLGLPLLYKAGVLAAVGSSMPFLALYVWRLTKEGVQMAAALSATELVLAREQKLHALDGLAAAAAHELGTPLSTITLVTNELDRQMPKDSPHREDILLLRSQAQRCREILQKLTRHPPDEDPLHASLTVAEMLHEGAAPHFGARAPVYIRAQAAASAAGPAARQPVGMRRPGVIYGVSNIIENAVDFAETRVDIVAEWDAVAVNVTISDDGPGFPAEIIENLGEPYVTTRSSGSKRRGGGEKVAGLGLGFFIAKTLLERSGARLELENHELPRHGAIVRIHWPRHAFEANLPDRGSEDLRSIPRPLSPNEPVTDAI